METFRFTKEEVAKVLGMTVPAYEAAMERERKHWCSCEKPSEGVDFCDDGQRRNEHCCSKHHYHCQNCGKIVQVG
jgi:hypothetical protein